MIKLHALGIDIPYHGCYSSFMIEYRFYDKQSYSFYFIDTAIFIRISKRWYFFLNIGIA